MKLHAANPESVRSPPFIHSSQDPLQTFSIMPWFASIDERFSRHFNVERCLKELRQHHSALQVSMDPTCGLVATLQGKTELPATTSMEYCMRCDKDTVLLVPKKKSILADASHDVPKEVQTSSIVTGFVYEFFMQSVLGELAASSEGFVCWKASSDGVWEFTSDEQDVSCRSAICLGKMQWDASQHNEWKYSSEFFVKLVISYSLTEDGRHLLTLQRAPRSSTVDGEKRISLPITQIPLMSTKEVQVKGEKILTTSLQPRWSINDVCFSTRVGLQPFGAQGAGYVLTYKRDVKPNTNTKRLLYEHTSQTATLQVTSVDTFRPASSLRQDRYAVPVLVGGKLWNGLVVQKEDGAQAEVPGCFITKQARYHKSNTSRQQVSSEGLWHEYPVSCTIEHEASTPLRLLYTHHFETYRFFLFHISSGFYVGLDRQQTTSVEDLHQERWHATPLASVLMLLSSDFAAYATYTNRIREMINASSHDSKQKRAWFLPFALQSERDVSPEHLHTERQSLIGEGACWLGVRALAPLFAEQFLVGVSQHLRLPLPSGMHHEPILADNISGGVTFLSDAFLQKISQRQMTLYPEDITLGTISSRHEPGVVHFILDDPGKTNDVDLFRTTRKHQNRIVSIPSHLGGGQIPPLPKCSQADVLISVGVTTLTDNANAKQDLVSREHLSIQGTRASVPVYGDPAFVYSLKAHLEEKTEAPGTRVALNNATCKTANFWANPSKLEEVFSQPSQQPLFPAQTYSVPNDLVQLVRREVRNLEVLESQAGVTTQPRQYTILVNHAICTETFLHPWVLGPLLLGLRVQREPRFPQSAEIRLGSEHCRVLCITTETSEKPVGLVHLEAHLVRKQKPEIPGITVFLSGTELAQWYGTELNIDSRSGEVYEIRMPTRKLNGCHALIDRVEHKRRGLTVHKNFYQGVDSPDCSYAASGGVHADVVTTDSYLHRVPSVKEQHHVIAVVENGLTSEASAASYGMHSLLLMHRVVTHHLYEFNWPEWLKSKAFVNVEDINDVTSVYVNQGDVLGKKMTVIAGTGVPTIAYEEVRACAPGWLSARFARNGARDDFHLPDLTIVANHTLVSNRHTILATLTYTEGFDLRSKVRYEEVNKSKICGIVMPGDKEEKFIAWHDPATNFDGYHVVGSYVLPSMFLKRQTGSVLQEKFENLTSITRTIFAGNNREIHSKALVIVECARNTKNVQINKEAVKEVSTKDRSECVQSGPLQAHVAAPPRIPPTETIEVCEVCGRAAHAHHGPTCACENQRASRLDLRMHETSLKFANTVATFSGKEAHFTLKEETVPCMTRATYLTSFGVVEETREPERMVTDEVTVPPSAVICFDEERLPDAGMPFVRLCVDGEGYLEVTVRTDPTHIRAHVRDVRRTLMLNLPLFAITETRLGWTQRVMQNCARTSRLTSGSGIYEQYANESIRDYRKRLLQMKTPNWLVDQIRHVIDPVIFPFEPGSRLKETREVRLRITWCPNPDAETRSSENEFTMDDGSADPEYERHRSLYLSRCSSMGLGLWPERPFGWRVMYTESPGNKAEQTRTVPVTPEHPYHKALLEALNANLPLHESPDPLTELFCVEFRCAYASYKETHCLNHSFFHPCLVKELPGNVSANDGTLRFRLVFKSEAHRDLWREQKQTYREILSRHFEWNDDNNDNDGTYREILSRHYEWNDDNNDNDGYDSDDGLLRAESGKHMAWHVRNERSGLGNRQEHEESQPALDVTKEQGELQPALEASAVDQEQGELQLALEASAADQEQRDLQLALANSMRLDAASASGAREANGRQVGLGDFQEQRDYELALKASVANQEAENLQLAVANNMRVDAASASGAREANGRQVGLGDFQEQRDYELALKASVANQEAENLQLAVANNIRES